MSLPSAVIDALIASGCTAEQLGAAMKAANSADDMRREARRANNAERQRRYRERHNTEVTQSNALPDVTNGDNVTAPALSRPPNENISNPPTHTHPKEKPRARAAAEHSLPDDWEPRPFGLGSKSRAIVDGWPPGEEAAQLEHFRAHHRKKGDRFVDWQAAWSTWALNSRTMRNGRRTGFDAKPTTREIGQGLAEQLAAGTSRTGDSRTDSVLSLGPPGRYVAG